MSFLFSSQKAFHATAIVRQFQKLQLEHKSALVKDIEKKTEVGKPITPPPLPPSASRKVIEIAEEKQTSKTVTTSAAKSSSSSSSSSK